MSIDVTDPNPLAAAFLYMLAEAAKPDACDATREAAQEMKVAAINALCAEPPK